MTATGVLEHELPGTLAATDTPGADTPDPGAAAPPPEVVLPPGLRPWEQHDRLAGWLVTALIGLFAGITRFWALGYPSSKIFDEVYYATEAREMLRWGYEDNRGFLFIVHPPLGKWLIAAGSLIWHSGSPTASTPSGIYDYRDVLGWRLAPALFGTLAVIVMVRLARRMFRSTLLGGIAGLLLALDGLTLVLSRTAILDIFLEFFILAGFAALVADRDQMRSRLARMIATGADLSAGIPTLGPRPWRLFAGVLFGCALAVKWSGLSFWLGLALLSLVWDRGALRAAGVRHSWRQMGLRSGIGALGSLLAAPIGTYLLTYLGWFTGENGWNRQWASTHSASTHLHLLGLRIPFWWGWVPAPIRSLGAATLQAYRFHEGLDSGHTYESKPWGWLVDGRPVDFFYQGNSQACGATSCSREVLLLGTPLLWWAFVPMLLWLGWHWFTTRDWRAGAVWVAFATGWLVWFQDLKRTMFFFYMAPLVPFLVLGLTLGLGMLLGPAVRLPRATPAAEPGGPPAALGTTGDVGSARGNPFTALFLRRRRLWGIVAVSVYLGFVIVNFAFYWPVFTGGLLTYHEWHLRMWLSSWI